MEKKTKTLQISKIAAKAANHGFADILHDKNLAHVLPFFKFLKHRPMLPPPLKLRRTRKLRQAGKNREQKIPDPASLIQLLTELGPGFIEAARIAASRSDLVEQKYQNDLLNLSYQLQGLERRSIRSVLRRELGRAAAKDFEHIDESAYHVNLLGNTYRGILHDGTRVLITINFDKAIKEFSKNMDQIHWLVEYIMPGLDKARAFAVKSVFDELEARAQVMLDLTNAGMREEILSEQFKNNKKIIIPQVFWEYTNPRVLTQTYRSLPAFSDIAQSRVKFSQSKKYLIRYLLDAFAYQYLQAGHFLLRPRLANWQAAEKNSIVFNNFLALGYLDSEERHCFKALLRAVLENNAKAASKALLKAHYGLHDLENHHLSGINMRAIEGKTISEKLWFCLEHAWQGNLLIPLGISMAAESILYLEHAIERFDNEVDLGDALLQAIKRA